MKKREVVLVIIFSVITCGIYPLYWFYVNAQALNESDSEEPLMNFALAVLLGMVTCEIYLLYWYYKFYKKVDKVTGDDNWVLNFVLSLFLTPIIGMAIAQNSINKIAVE